MTLRRLTLILCVLMGLAMLPSLEGATHTGTLEIYCTPEQSGAVYTSEYANFTEAWLAQVGNDTYMFEDYTDIGLGTYEYHEEWSVLRGFFTFDTSELKKNWRVESASFDFYSMGVGGGDYNWTIKLQKWIDTDDALTVEDYTAFDGVNYDDSSVQQNDNGMPPPYTWIIVPINDDNLFTPRGETKICLRLDCEIAGQAEDDAYVFVLFGNHGEYNRVRLTINYVWGAGKVKQRGIDLLPFAVAGVILCGGISFVALKKDKARRLYQ